MVVLHPWGLLHGLRQLFLTAFLAGFGIYAVRPWQTSSFGVSTHNIDTQVDSKHGTCRNNIQSFLIKHEAKIHNAQNIVLFVIQENITSIMNNVQLT